MVALGKAAVSALAWRQAAENPKDKDWVDMATDMLAQKEVKRLALGRGKSFNRFVFPRTLRASRVGAEVSH